MNAPGFPGPPASNGWLDRYRAEPTERLVRMDGRTLWFSERSQQIHDLNETAALVWRGLADGEPPVEIGLALVRGGMDRVEAEDHVRTLLGRWLGAGDLVPEDLLARRARPTGSRALKIGDLSLRVDFHGGSPSLEFDAVFGQFAGVLEPPSVVYELIARGELTFLRKDGSCRGAAEADGVMPLLKAAFTQDLTDTLKDGFVAHAACLHRDGAAWLLTGPAGTGKTTLCAALTRRGFRYGGDDITAFAPDGRVRGIPFAMALKAGAWPLCAGLFPRLGQLPIHQRADGQAVRYLPPTRPQAKAAPLGTVVALSREDGAQARLETVAAATVLTGLLAESYSPRRRLSAGQFEAAAEAVAAARCFRLIYSELDPAVAALAALAP